MRAPAQPAKRGERRAFHERLRFHRKEAVRRFVLGLDGMLMHVQRRQRVGAGIVAQVCRRGTIASPTMRPTARTLVARGPPEARHVCVAAVMDEAKNWQAFPA